jgi:16S rRNA U1498 N3-methylase RsmE
VLFKEKGAQIVSLGQTVLRAETAAIVACAFATI